MKGKEDSPAFLFCLLVIIPIVFLIKKQYLQNLSGTYNSFTNIYQRLNSSIII